MTKPRMIKMGLIVEEKQVVLVERPLEVVGEQDVLIKIQACNICTSEYGVWSGARKNRSLPMTFGHEWSGEIIELGRGVTEFAIGDKVAGSYPYDVYSEAAKEGRTSEAPGIPDYETQSEEGYYGRYRGCGEYLVMPQASLFKMNPDLSPSERGFLEPVATVVAGIGRLGFKGDETVIVIGAGTMGLLNALVLREYGLKVVLTEVSPPKIMEARLLGFEVINSHQQDVVEESHLLTGKQGVDAVILAAGTTEANHQAVNMLKPLNGSLLLFAAGYPAPDLGLTTNEIHYRKLKIQGTFSADYQDFKEGARLLNEGKIDVSPLVNQCYSLAELQEAFEDAVKSDRYRVSVLMGD